MGNKTRDFDLLVIGEINPDLIAQGKEIVPEFNQTEKLIEKVTLTIGSSSVIMACGAARLGLRVAFIGLVGNDYFGHFMLQEMQSHAIDTSGCIVDNEISTGISIILATSNDRAILTYPGSIPEIQFSHIDKSLLQRAKHVHVGSYFLLEGLQPDLPKLLKNAKETGLTTSLDTNWDPHNNWNVEDIIPYCDIFLPNEVELLKITKEKNINSGLEKLSMKIPIIAVKLGEKGAIVKQGLQYFESPGLKVDVVDTVGAGDSFDAGFIFGYLGGYTLQKSLQIACICGSLSTRSSGGTSGQATIEDLVANGIDLGVN